MEEGLEVHARARTLFPNGIMIPFSKTTSAAKKTQTLLNDKTIKALFEATFTAEGFVTKADVIERKGRQKAQLNLNETVIPLVSIGCITSIDLKRIAIAESIRRYFKIYTY